MSIILIGREQFLNLLKFCINIKAVTSTSPSISNKQKEMFPVLLFTLVAVQDICKKGKFLLKERNLSNVKENKQKNFMVYLWKKIIPVQLMEQPTWWRPIVFTWIIFNLTIVFGILF